MVTPLSARELAQYIDHTLLLPEATRADVARLCQEAREWKFHSVCVHGSRVAQACALLEDSEVKVCAVAGFPLGAMDADAKRYETEVAVDLGASEIDVVLNVGRLKDGDHAYIVRELRDVVEAADERVVKLILETVLLTNEEKVLACRLAMEAEVHFVKTCTGFNGGGATVEDVRILRETVGRNCGVKASGGVRDLAKAMALIQAGASRIGTSAGPTIMQGLAADGGSY